MLLESSAPSIRSVHGPQQPEGCQGNSPRGERCRLCQVSRDWHREHTWSGITCPGQGCALSQPRAWDRSNPCIQPHDVLRESNIQGLQGSNHCWLHSAPLLPEASKGFGPCSLRSCCTALGRAEQQLLCRASTATHWCHFLGTNVPSLDRNRS